MTETDWQGLSDARFKKSSTILEPVEFLADESLSLKERAQLREDYRIRHGVTDRAIRNCIARFRTGGAQALLSPKALEHGLPWQNRHSLVSEDGRISFRRFQAARPLDLVQGDARDGNRLDTKDGKRRTYLFVWVDVYSRKLLSGGSCFDEKLPRMEDAFKRLVLRWGIPQNAYLDNGSVHVAKQLAWILAQPSAAKLRHKPFLAYRKGKAEALNTSIKNVIQGKAQRAGFQPLEERNSAFASSEPFKYAKARAI